MKVFVLTHEYFDKSGFQVCGVTANHTVAQAWMHGNPENHVYDTDLEAIMPHQIGLPPWKNFTAPDRIGNKGDEHES